MAGADSSNQERADAESVEHSGSKPLIFLVVAVLGAVGLWLFFAGDDANDAELAESVEAPVTISSAPQVPRAEAADLGAGYQLLGSADRPGRTVSFVRRPFDRGGTTDSEIFTLLDGELLRSSAGRELTSLGQISSFYAHPGERREYVLATKSGTVLTNLGVGQFVPYDPQQGSVSLGEGFSLLPGPDDDSVWLFTSAERSARLVDIGSGNEVLTVDLTIVGRPLDAVEDGLILTNETPTADFGLWTPDEGRRLLPGTAGTAYVGAAASTVVFASGTELLVMDLEAPGDTARRIPNPEPAIYRTTVSPDGSSVAASVVTSITEPNRIVVLDLADGTELHRVSSSLEVLFQWSSPTRLFYLRPDWPAFDLVERDITTGVDANVVRLEDLSWWYTALEQSADDATMGG